MNKRILRFKYLLCCVLCLQSILIFVLLILGDFTKYYNQGSSIEANADKVLEYFCKLGLFTIYFIVSNRVACYALNSMMACFASQLSNQQNENKDGAGQCPQNC